MLTANIVVNQRDDQALSPIRRGSILRILSAYLAENGEMLRYSAGPGLPAIMVTLRKTNSGYNVDLYEVARGYRAKSTISYVKAADADVAEGDGIQLHPPPGQPSSHTVRGDSILFSLEREIPIGFRERFRDHGQPGALPLRNKIMDVVLRHPNDGDLAKFFLKEWGSDIRPPNTEGLRTLLFTT